MMKHLKINFKQAALTFILVLMAFRFAVPCTSVIISGEHTKDGRPIMWKHRDTRTFDNKLAYIGSGKYSAVALINSEDEDAEKIWIGFNSAGFAIMNTLSYNVDGEEDENGEFMKKALMECATVDEFEKFIQNSSKPRKVASNFGVIDAEGGAAYFETGEESYTRFDASKVFNADNTGITQKLMPLNKQIYDKTTEKMEQWRSGKEREEREKEIKDLYNWYDKKVRETYADQFDSIRHIQK
ncbi:MAG: carcinine hydrolase/isopenicillin-N N-acyltransferase family protein [Bacteroidales bacterium]